MALNMKKSKCRLTLEFNSKVRDRFRPAQRVRVRVRDGLPQRVDGLAAGTLGVSQRAGPWRLFGEWWGERCFARDYFDVELSDRGVYRMYHNLEDDSWYVDGIYD